MSMSAEEILLNCEKQFGFINTDINILISYINELLKHCEEIDGSEFYKKQINDLLKELIREQKEITENTFERELSSDTHVAIETYHDIQRYVERKRDILAEFKVKVLNFKKDVVLKEQENILNSLDKNHLEDLEKLKNKLFEIYKSTDDHVFINNLFKNQNHQLINMKSEEIYNFVAKEISGYKSSEEVIAQEMIGISILPFVGDNEILKETQNNFKKIDTKNLKNFFADFSKTVEQEYVRKDNIIKIVKAIREVGYIVNENNIRRIEEKNLVLIHGEKITGETADFAVKLDGSFVYNWEGFEGHEHDADAQAFIKKMKEFNLHSSQEFKKQYREPKFVAKNKIQQKNKNSSSGK